MPPSNEFSSPPLSETSREPMTKLASRVVLAIAVALRFHWLSPVSTLPKYSGVLVCMVTRTALAGVAAATKRCCGVRDAFAV